MDRGLHHVILPALAIQLCVIGLCAVYYRLKSRRLDFATIISAVLLVVFTAFSVAGMFPYVLFFGLSMIAADLASREPGAKIVVFSALIYLVTRLILYNCGFTVPIIRLFVYNNMFGMPMDWFAKAMGITDPAVRSVIYGFISEQSAFMFKATTQGLIFAGAAAYAHLCAVVAAKSAPGAKNLPSFGPMIAPRSTPILLAAGYAAQIFLESPVAREVDGPLKIIVSAAAAFLISAFADFLFKFAGTRSNTKKLKIAVFIAAFAVIIYEMPPSALRAQAVAELVWTTIIVVYTFHGMRLVYRAFGSGSGRKAFVIALFMTAFVIHEIFFAMCVLGFLENVFGMSKLIERAEEGKAVAAARSGATAGSFIASFAAVAVVALIVSRVALPRGGTGAPGLFDRFDLPEKSIGYSLEQRGDETLVAGPGVAYFIDRFEYPNKEGERPVSNVTIEQAARMCESAGKRLCEAEEWARACAGGDDNMFFYVHPEKFESYTFVEDACSWRDENSANRKFESGAYPECANRHGIHDMAGSLWEWVATPGNPGMAGLMGPGERNGCQRCRSCDWAALYFADQQNLLELEKIGFRCCRDAD
ncbi:MAG TPA: SUMF1/EgtB/PvdO family nonheme iron enzyme [bacterium]|nr:SUMF1/EgtB/PvdO family nonheme iron enzyme [bacterium]